jgi:hypothetical protein
MLFSSVCGHTHLPRTRGWVHPPTPRSHSSAFSLCRQFLSAGRQPMRPIHHRAYLHPLVYDMGPAIHSHARDGCALHVCVVQLPGDLHGGGEWLQRPPRPPKSVSNELSTCLATSSMATTNVSSGCLARGSRCLAILSTATAITMVDLFPRGRWQLCHKPLPLLFLHPQPSLPLFPFH